MWNKMNIGAPSLADFYYFTVRRGFKEGVEHSIWQCPRCSLRHLKVTFVFRLCSAARQESTTREGCNPGTTLGSITIWTLPSFGTPPWPRAPSGPFSAVFFETFASFRCAAPDYDAASGDPYDRNSFTFIFHYHPPLFLSFSCSVSSFIIIFHGLAATSFFFGWVNN